MVPCDFTSLRRASSELTISSQWVVELSADSAMLTHHYKCLNADHPALRYLYAVKILHSSPELHSEPITQQEWQSYVIFKAVH